MNWMIGFSIKHPISALMICLAGACGGIVSMLLLPIDRYPILGVNRINVSAAYEGASAGEIREMIVMPLEDALSSLKGLKDISSVSREGTGTISLDLHWGSDGDLALAECREIIDASFERLPADCPKPVAVKDHGKSGEILSIAVIPAQGGIHRARRIAEDEALTRLQRLKGAGSVRVIGGLEERVEVSLDRDILEARNMSVSTVAETLSAMNYEYPAGIVREGDKDILFKTSARFKTLEEILETPLTGTAGGLLRVRDMGTVGRGNADRDSFFMIDGLQAILIGVGKKQDASPVSLSREVRSELDRLNAMFSREVTFRVYRDESEDILSGIFNLLISALAGMVITALVVYLSFSDLVSAFVIATVIPLSAFFAAIVLSAAGRTINTMSLAGLAVGIGMVVDAATVVLENVRRKGLESTEEATREVSGSNLGSALTTVVVFLPVLFAQGMVGELFSDMAISIIASILISCVLSLTYVPALYMSLRKFFPERHAMIQRRDIAKELYAKVLGHLFRKPQALAAPLGLCVVLGTISLTALGIELSPRLATDTLLITADFKSGTTIEAMEAFAQSLTKSLSELPFVESIAISGGMEKKDIASLSDPLRVKESLTCTLILGDRGFAQERIEEEVSRSLVRGGLHAQVRPGEDALARLLGLEETLYMVKGDSPEEALEEAGRYALEGTTRPYSSLKELTFVPDRVAMSRFGISPASAANLARGALTGIGSGTMSEGGKEIPIILRLQEKHRMNPNELERMFIPTQGEGSVRLGMVGRMETRLAEKVLYRHNKKDARLFAVGDQGSIESLDSPRAEQTADFTRTCLFMAIAALTLLYFTLGAQFESWTIPLLLLLALPLAFAGASGALYLTGKTLNLHSMIGMLILFGTAVNNTILLYEHCVHSLARRPYGRIGPVIYRACIEKSGAVLLTSLTTLCALIPFAIDPGNASAQSHLAVAIIGGFGVSTPLVLAITPILLTATLKGRRV